jgi:hypothetical protein
LLLSDKGRYQGKHTTTKTVAMVIPPTNTIPLFGKQCDDYKRKRRLSNHFSKNMPFFFLFSIKPTMEPEKKRGKRKNKPKGTSNPVEWKDSVWNAFSTRLESNTNSKGDTYYTTTPMTNTTADAPPCLVDEECWNPSNSPRITVCVDDRQYQMAMHRIMLLLRLRSEGRPLPTTREQASHICADAINTDGRGATHCCNPDHMVIEDDKTNKSRQRCAGWIWIHKYNDHIGGYWYPSCTHNPPCKTYTPKHAIPTILAIDN